MICRYVNSKGRTIDLMKSPYRLITGNFFSYEWEAISYGGKIYGFERKAFEKEVKLDVFCKKSEFAARMNELESVFSEDIFNETPGKLYVNGEYLACYISGIKKDEWEAGIYTIVTLTILSDHPFWISEQKKVFYRRDADATNEGLNYPHNYPHNYTVSGRGVVSWYIEHVTSSPFYLVIYGPVTDPRILINGQVYEVYTTLEANEYLTIDSRSNEIQKHMSNGTIVSLYDYRNKDESIFTQIPAGPLDFNWSGTFGYDMTVFVERNEPLWN